MALIICKNCGKKISDTIDVCIHCGCNLKETENPEQASQAQNETSQICELQQTDFDDLIELEQTKLEAEFLKEDEWSNKYMRDRLELKSFAKPLFFYPFLAYAVSLIFIRTLGLFLDMDTFFSGDIVNPTAKTVAIISGVGLAVLCVAMFVYSIAKRLHNGVTHARYIYYKRFQKWLIEKKNITFFPKMKTLRQNRIFESITIEGESNGTN